MLYRVVFHNFDRFLTVYEGRFEKEYGHFRPVVKEVVERYLDCGNPRSGFARIRCPDCHSEHLLTFVAEKPPPAYVFEQPALMAAEESGECE